MPNAHTTTVAVQPTRNLEIIPLALPLVSWQLAGTIASNIYVLKLAFQELSWSHWTKLEQYLTHRIWLELLVLYCVSLVEPYTTKHQQKSATSSFHWLQPTNYAILVMITQIRGQAASGCHFADTLAPTQLSSFSIPPFNPWCHSREKRYQTSPHFFYCKQEKLGTRLKWEHASKQRVYWWSCYKMTYLLTLMA